MLRQRPRLDEIRELNAFYRNNNDKVALYAVNYDGLPIQKQQHQNLKGEEYRPNLRNPQRQTIFLDNALTLISMAPIKWLQYWLSRIIK